MDINPVSSSNLIENTTRVNENKQKFKQTSNSAPSEVEAAAVFEKSEPDSTQGKLYTRDSVTLSGIYSQTEQRYASFISLVEKLITAQSIKYGESRGSSYQEILEKYEGGLKSFYLNLEVDESTRLSAQQDISQDGFWGVKQTSERLVQFAKALAGGDKSKLGAIKAAVEKGFSKAEAAWGGALPEICAQTKEATLKTLDEWADEAK